MLLLNSFSKSETCESSLFDSFLFYPRSITPSNDILKIFNNTFSARWFWLNIIRLTICRIFFRFHLLKIHYTCSTTTAIRLLGLYLLLTIVSSLKRCSKGVFSRGTWLNTLLFSRVRSCVRLSQTIIHFRQKLG